MCLLVFDKDDTLLHLCIKSLFKVSNICGLTSAGLLNVLKREIQLIFRKMGSLLCIYALNSCLLKNSHFIM